LKTRVWRRVARTDECRFARRPSSAKTSAVVEEAVRGKPMSWVEVNMERLLFASRWLMAPFYVGLAVSLAVLLLKFCQELAHFLPNLVEMKETDLILWILTLIDLSLAGNLLLIVIFSGFENFVSKMDVGEHEDKPAWMGKVDFGGLKLKLVASIVAISAIQLLKTFMNIHAADERQTFWQVIVHLTFVVSGVLLATMDWIAGKARALHEGH
jgi:uncharacterized protein (TIGR00645 family)